MYVLLRGHKNRSDVVLVPQRLVDGNGITTPRRSTSGIPTYSRYEPCKAWSINEFVRLRSLGKELQDPFAPDPSNEGDCILVSHVRLHQETCRNIDNLTNFRRTTRFVGELL